MSKKCKKADSHCGCKPKKQHISPTDPNGSYTGRPVCPDEKPVQDVDDL